jgi:hypothetical protein
MLYLATLVNSVLHAIGCVWERPTHWLGEGKIRLSTDIPVIEDYAEVSVATTAIAHVVELRWMRIFIGHSQSIFKSACMSKRKQRYDLTCDWICDKRGPLCRASLS